MSYPGTTPIFTWQIFARGADVHLDPARIVTVLSLNYESERSEREKRVFHHLYTLDYMKYEYEHCIFGHLAVEYGCPIVGIVNILRGASSHHHHPLPRTSLVIERIIYNIT